MSQTLHQAVLPLLLAGVIAPAATAAQVDEIVVTASRSPAPLYEYAGSLSALGSDDINGVAAKHIHELMTRVPGVWLSRGSGQEHLTAIRSPVLTGPGSCGAFLFLEDGIPIRPAGFCNVNQMFEMPTELASRIEVIRGPGNALYGSNALHGMVNVILPSPDDRPAGHVSVEAGANEFLRVTGLLPPAPDATALVAFAFADDGGFRDDSGYRQVKLNGKAQTDFAGGSLEVAASLTALDQETAGFIFGEDAYKDAALNRGNVNPEAFRKADSQRLYAIWRRDLGGKRLDIRPYVRRSDMEFLQHFLPGQPLEENGHVSAGFLSLLAGGSDAIGWTVGFDLDLSDAFLRQTQDGPTEGSDFLVETRPPGKHYDFEVRGMAVASYAQLDFMLSERVTFDAGLRAEYTHYDYNNRMLAGNTRDDGTECGFGGCLYSRPADRADSFTNVAPKLGIRFDTDPAGSLYLAVSRGFRAPQMTELYRLQSGQEIADLDSEELDNVEIGYRRTAKRLAWQLSLFAMQKRNSVYRDAEGFSVSGGRTRHEGAELKANWSPADAWRLALNLSYARHSYDFDTVASRGETFVSGRDVDTAPRWLGSAELFYEPAQNWMVALQVTGIDQYFLDAENRFTYPGHVIGNLRASLNPTEALSVAFRLNNITNRDYADRADYAFGDYRYFPGRGRELFVELRFSLD